MEGIVPKDFVAWVTPAKGLRIVTFAKKIGVSMTYDDKLKYVKSTYLTIKKPLEKGGALRSPQQDFKTFWKAWRAENPGEQQFCARPKVADDFVDEQCEVSQGVRND